jgi:hydroxyacylglutathione hydrolase
MEVQSFLVSPVQSNCYVISESSAFGSNAVIIDPGDTNLDKVFEYIDSRGLHMIANWNTHAHFDHVMGVDIVRKRYRIPSYVHQDDLWHWQHMHESVRMWTGQRDFEPLTAPDGYFQDGDTLYLGNESFTVIHTPGHSPGSICLVGREIALTGDTLFAGTIGRTDLPLSSPTAMKESLKKLLPLSDNLILYPGHMSSTTMKRERQTNPFLQGIS